MPGRRPPPTWPQNGAATWSPHTLPQGSLRHSNASRKVRELVRPRSPRTASLHSGAGHGPAHPCTSLRFSHSSLGAAALSPFPPWTMPHRVLEGLWVPGQGCRGEGNKTTIFSFCQIMGLSTSLCVFLSSFQQGFSFPLIGNKHFLLDTLLSPVATRKKYSFQ